MIDWSAHLSTLFPDVAPERRPDAAAAVGFALAETWWPPAGGPDAWVASMRAAGLGAACVNADGGDLAAGERGFCNVPGRRDDVVAAAVAAARAVTALGGRCVNLLAGRARPGVARDADLGEARAAVRAAAEAVAPMGATLVIEHLNPVDVREPLLPTPRDAAVFVAAVGHPNVRVLFDCYHAAAAGCDPLAELAAVLPVVGHVQYADHPGRGAPGTGRIALGNVVRALHDGGYRGSIGLECVPAGGVGDVVRALSGLHPGAPFPAVR